MPNTSILISQCAVAFVGKVLDGQSTCPAAGTAKHEPQSIGEKLQAVESMGIAGPRFIKEIRQLTGRHGSFELQKDIVRFVHPPQAHAGRGRT